jgi:metal-responsive CopG/Arc/MetJ family transcriptional regulator
MTRRLTKVLSVSLPPELEKKVGLAAKHRGVTRSQFIRLAVLDALVEQGSRTALRMKVRSAP